MGTRAVTKAAAGFAVLAALLAVVLPGTASASRRQHHPLFNHGLTIAANPDPISAGQGILIYGQLKGPNNAHKWIWLFHRINPAPRFTPIGRTRTNAEGYYEFVRADGVVVSNRNWFVLGPRDTHSRTIHEHVSAVVTLKASTSNVTTAQPVTFTGTVYPTHRHERVLLQQQNSTSGTGWQTVASGYTGDNSAFTITHRFKSAGSYTLRAFFPNDPRNIAGESADLSLTVQQQQNPSFTINGSPVIVTDGQPETISGTLYAAGSTTTPQPHVAVILYGKQWGGGFKALATGVTEASGNYTFTQVPLHNTVYRVQTVTGKPMHTAILYVGVQDVVSANLSQPSVAVGAAVTISGTVTPDHSGHVIHLQEQDSAGNWVDIESGYLTAGSTYSFTYKPGQTGTEQLRVEITGGPVNIGGVSNVVTLNVNGVAPANTLPPAS